MVSLRTISLLFLIPGFCSLSGKPAPLEKTVYHRLGDRKLPLVETSFGQPKGIVFVNLHDDERTSVEATRSILEIKGGQLLRIENLNRRFIRFKVRGKFYSFDPNGMFTPAGVDRNLRLMGRYHPEAAKSIRQLGERFIQMLPKPTSLVISLHNNTEGYFSINSYTDGGEKSQDAKKVFINPDEDPDDFFLVTRESLFQKIKDKGFNCVLQDNEACTDDGSLSVYCGKNDIPYVNCETEHGKVTKYREMMEWFLEKGL